MKAEETGLLCPPQEDAAFAEAIDRILSNPTWGDRLKEASRERVENLCSWDGVATQLGELDQQLLTETLIEPYLEKAIA
ncbi:hypothetical protein NG796_04520 [Laspinema sp. A4]|uniref:hypothetical protein n=1 Tax=Laspinema sp. D2d TaxID=2953686 RepID=UPI0021BB65F0|nr:hypothetical protein [Laspinema sp. D2d]MCT7982552.1 hypothetical protein [Laspinema sp. D2d]